MHHNSVLRSAGYCLSTALVLAVGTFGTAITAVAQEFQDLQTPKGSLVLKGQGSYFVGGDVIVSDGLGAGRPPGHITINQMYVEYMIPQGGDKNVPLVIIHGGGLSGKTWETTPDGRMGLDEYFLRKGHAVYNVDQASRARAGFDPTIINKVRAGLLPPTALPDIGRTSDERAWSNFRFGPSFGVPWPDEQFPVDAADEFAKQGIPSLNGFLSAPDPNFKDLSDLAIQVGGAVLMGHSQSGRFPAEAALVNSTGTKGLILTEPGGCNAIVYTDQQIAKLATVPILVMFNDHLNTPGSTTDWLGNFNDCKAFITRVNAAGGNAKMLHPPELGIFGNSHMWMLDKNNLQLADLILKWIDENVGAKKTAGK